MCDPEYYLLIVLLYISNASIAGSISSKLHSEQECGVLN
uniref:Uncharacterized protein n=1 Tax=Anguilla anguilla TaxID=7936 RepID=A0A0E9W1A6_ANGAN